VKKNEVYSEQCGQWKETKFTWNCDSGKARSELGTVNSGKYKTVERREANLELCVAYRRGTV